MSIANEQMLEHLLSGHELTNEMVITFVDRILGGTINAVQVAAMLAGLRAKHISPDELAYFANVVIKKSVPIEKPSYPYADIVGTGGDGHNTINVSTLASLIVASMGYPIAKHGNVSVSSKCGAADVLRELGINIDLDAAGVKKSLDVNQWCFLFAPHFHPTYQAVKEVRKQLGIKTFFNILGPLVNPMSPPYMIVGVYHEDLLMPFAHVLKSLKRTRALVVHGSGLDEIAVHGPTKALYLHDGHIEGLTFDPKSLGLASFPLDHVRGGSAQENARICIDVLKGDAPLAMISLVAASAGALLWLFDDKKPLKECVERAYHTIKSGSAFFMIEKLKEFSHGA